MIKEKVLGQIKIIEIKENDNGTCTIIYEVPKDLRDYFYYDIKPGSILVDPWRSLPIDMPDVKVLHYGNTRNIL